ncbi:lactonase family protein [Streptococcus pluranimalium]|uniref:lactonase family protein n=1 Tax=Streptococcus pluranimalium TaxID=82348 RepID=UPI0039FC61BD
MIHTLLFGTYTKRLSQGIYQAKFDTKSGKLFEYQLFTKTKQPTYLAWANKGDLLAVKQNNKMGGIASFNADGKEINHVLLEGAPLCHLHFDQQRQLAYGANYHKGEISVYFVNSDGSLTLSDIIKHDGNGPHPNQETAHAHFVGLTPDNVLVTCDLGSDQMITYAISSEGRLNPLDTYDSTSGAGPRHLVLHPHLPIAYLLCELNASIEILSYTGNGHFERLDIISTIPDSYQDFNATAAIRLSSDGNFLYASNRGHDSIAVYKIQDNGYLELLQLENSRGNIPRDFILSPDEKHLIVAHQDSDNITVFKRSPETGRLTVISDDFHVPECVCLLFK